MFDQLTFNSTPGNGVQAVHFFENGFGVSVGLRGDGVSTFEVAILKGTSQDYELVYDTGITEDVINYQDKSEVGEIMEQVKNLK